MKNTTFPALVTQLASDLAECVDSTWALAVSKLGSVYLPFFTLGQPPDLNRCLAYVGGLTSDALRVQSEDDPRVSGGYSVRESWAPRIIRAIRVRGEICAVLLFGPKRARGEYTMRDRELVTGLSAHLSFLLEDEQLAEMVGTEFVRHQRTTSELDSARQVQQRFFPYHLPPIDGLDYYGECRPVGEVGGDFFDFASVDQTSLLVSIGDVSGKGVPAAIIMAGVQASLRALGLNHRGRISDLIENLNRMVWQLSPDNFYATLFYARIDGVRRELHYVNAGHDRALLLRNGAKRAISLECTGTVLGLSTRSVYTERTVRLEIGDVLVAITDGITEAENSDGCMLDEKVVLAAVRDHQNVSSSDLAGHIIKAVDTFTGGAV
ncbi:MAG: PP2C family protein-serine/threonine phosphatase, partial [Acidobacteriota bacterium]|nr:PP2C family protein-serine/threonine phosphatase [Acidobacteriota bacterium]